MNGPQRLFEIASGPLGEVLNQARTRVADDGRLTKIAAELSRQGVPIDPGAIPATTAAAPSAWSLGAKIAAGTGGLLLLIGLGALLRPESRVPSAGAPSAARGSASASFASASARALVGSGPRPPRATGDLPGAAPEPAMAGPGAAESPAAADGAAAAGSSGPSSAPPSSLTPATGAALAARSAGESMPPSSPGAETSRSAPSATSNGIRGSSAAADKQSELAVLSEARAALGANPSRALALTERHRSEYPKSALVQERELIAITALARLGQTASAQQRAQRFRAAYPRSAYLKQIDRVLGQ
jgi:hypothetical protein